MNSLTDDNILWKYDRLYPYHTCKDITMCQTRDWGGVWHPVKGFVEELECFCHRECVLHRHQIADIWVPPFPEIRQYIRIGEECPICYEGIFTQTNAFLTLCGHAFHRLCLMQSHQTASLELGRDLFLCPLCREDQPGIFGEPLRFKDKMANYEMYSEFYFANECSDLDFDTNLVGMNSKCKSCLKYRETGKYVWET